MRNISPSLLSADFTNIRSQLSQLQQLGIDRIHLDVMDGHFVPNLTFGPFIIKQLKSITSLHFETHLMINTPEKYIQDYIDAGSDTLIFHYEATNIPHDLLADIKKQGVKCGLSIKPETPYQVLNEFTEVLDYILIMSVSPGFGGQGFIDSTLLKMEAITNLCINNNCRDRITIGVDGGINLTTIDKVYDTGIDIAIIGSGLFNANNLESRYKDLMGE